MINLKIGEWVKYIPSAGLDEIGRVKSWNDEYAFVVYSCDNNWDRFKDYTACATRLEDLVKLEGEGHGDC